MDLHNGLRAKLARGEEIRGQPGPQPRAANMMQMVIFISFEHALNDICSIKQLGMDSDDQSD